VLTLVVSALYGCVATSPPASAQGSAVIPTSSSPGTSTTTINNYQEVTFPANDDGTWPCGGSGNAPPSCPGPDGETGPTAYPMGFNIDFFGTEYHSVYTNNNGNLTFGAPLPTFTPMDLTSFDNPIVAPFFADVDTRSAGSALVNFGTGTLDGQKVFVVNWPGVGCFNENSTVLDNFQAILIDRPDRGTGALGDDFDMEFNYDSIQWDTGEASGGDVSCQNGPAGNTAYVGYSNGTTTAGDSYTLPGSGVPQTFLDSSTTTALIYNDLNSTTLGRYLFTVNAGQPTAPTTLSTSLSGGGQSGSSISVPAGTAVTDSATLAGANASSATGSVTYNVYSDSACTTLVNGGTAEPITTAGTLPGSASVTLATPGVYYWQVVYSGDATNDGSISGCSPGGSGNEVETVTPVAATAPGKDTLVDAYNAHGTVSATLTTTVANDLLVAFVAGCGPSTGGQTATVTSHGLTWRLVGRVNAQDGTSEVWEVRASGVVSGLQVTATLTKTGYPVFLTAVAFTNATGIGHVGHGSAGTGVPSATLTTSASPSWVWGVGNDPLQHTARKVPSGQTLQSQKLASTLDTFWVQSLNNENLPIGSTAKINDTGPKYDPWNLMLVEIL
jgi:Nidogen-like